MTGGLLQLLRKFGRLRHLRLAAQIAGIGEHAGNGIDGLPHARILCARIWSSPARAAVAAKERLIRYRTTIRLTRARLAAGAAAVSAPCWAASSASWRSFSRRSAFKRMVLASLAALAAAISFFTNCVRCSHTSRCAVWVRIAARGLESVI